MACVSHVFIASSSRLTTLSGLRLTEFTELGSNDSVKNPPPMEESSRSARKRSK